MLKKIVLIGFAILIPLGVADAKRYYKSGNQPELETTKPYGQGGVEVCLTDKNCWCKFNEPGGLGSACWCNPEGVPDGHVVRLSTLMEGTNRCVYGAPPSGQDKLPPGGTGKFLKQMKP